jgi:hypothetical protein
MGIHIRGPQGSVEPHGCRIDIDQNGSPPGAQGTAMNRILLTSLCLFASVALQAQMPPPEDIMRDNDADKDGKITKEEAKATELTNFFDLIDANKDGIITMEELKNVGPPG